MYEWQTLIGALLGGIIALIAALIVAQKVERREDLAAAMTIIAILVPIRVAARELQRLVDEHKLTKDNDIAAFKAEKLVHQRPHISAQLESAIHRIMPLDNVLAAHLTFFLNQYAETERKLEGYGTAIRQFQEGRTPARGKEYVLGDARSAMACFHRAAEHGECAEHLLNKFVLGRDARILRFWCRWFPDATTRKCREMLK